MEPTVKPIVRVTDQKQTTEPDGKGNLHQVWSVHYQTASGATGVMKIPDALHNAQNVAAALHAKATQIEDVARIGNSPEHAP
jgi:hypothetical protein